MAFDESHFPKHCAICKGRLADHGSHFRNPDRTLRFPCARCGGYTLGPDDENKLREELRDDGEVVTGAGHRLRIRRDGASVDSLDAGDVERWFVEPSSTPARA